MFTKVGDFLTISLLKLNYYCKQIILYILGRNLTHDFIKTRRLAYAV